MSTLTDIRTGAVMKIGGAPYLVVFHQFNRKQQRKPVMRTKLKNVITGATMDKTFLSGESFEFADIERRRCQYLYNDGTDANFMDNDNFEQFTLPVNQIEGAMQFLKDDTEVYVTFYEAKPIGVQPPIKVTLKVTETTPGVKGDTATGGSKLATVETGAEVDVPLFITEGEEIMINTETGEYAGRSN